MKKLVVWILDGVVAALSILAIVCYFFAPVLTLKVKYPLSAAQIQDMIASSLSDYDIEIEQGADLKIDLKIDMGLLFSSLGSGEATVNKLVDKNADNLAHQLKGTVGDITKTVAKQYAQQVVKDQVHAQLKNILSTEDADHITEKLENAGIGDEYLAQKTDELFDLISSGDVSVGEITDEVLKTVDDVYGKLKTSGDEDFKDINLTEADRTSIKNKVTDALGDFASSDGTLNLDEYVNNFLADALHDLNSAKAESSIVLLAAEGGQSGDALTQEIKTTLINYIPSEVTSIISIVLIVALVLVILSMLSWLYILIKLIVKVSQIAKAEPTVRLKMPIILGWLPFLILVIVPSIAFPAIKGILGPQLSALSVSFSSIGWIALMCAAICLGISIFFMVVRGKEKKAQEAYSAPMQIVSPSEPAEAVPADAESEAGGQSTQFMPEDDNNPLNNGGFGFNGGFGYNGDDNGQDNNF